MPEPVKPRTVVVVGADGEAVGGEVRRRRAAGARAAGFVGADEAMARAMAEEMLGGADELVAAPGEPGEGSVQPTS